MDAYFWEKPLASLNAQEWEAICDGCGQCCLTKLQDDETDEIVATNVVCRFHNQSNGQCTVYAERAIKKPECFVIERDNAEHYSWLPQTCAYRLRFENKPLPEWHPLLIGNRKAMNTLGISVKGWCVSEAEVDDENLHEHVLFSLSGSSQDAE